MLCRVLLKRESACNNKSFKKEDVGVGEGKKPFFKRVFLFSRKHFLISTPSEISMPSVEAAGEVLRFAISCSFVRHKKGHTVEETSSECPEKRENSLK